MDDYREAVAEAMRVEYEAIVAAGLILQLDSPDLGLGRHTMYKSLPEPDFLKAAEAHVETLNHALRNIPRDKMRIHVCWGNYDADGMTPGVGLSPTTPQKLAGVRTEPPKSVPWAKGIEPDATAAADPPLEPPVLKARL
jgi:hypothetical protein